jgi:hypothetical protein
MRIPGSLALALLLVVNVGCKKDDKPAPEPGGDAAPKVAPAPAADAAQPAPAPADSCELVGTLELRRLEEAKGCGEPGRYSPVKIELVAATPRGDKVELELADPLELGNVDARAEARRADGGCEVALTIADAGRADDDESFSYTLQVPPAGGKVTGTLDHGGATPDLEPCTTKSPVEGTFTRRAK